MDYNKKYEMIVGLETHVELKTQSKIFCSCSTAFGAPPNTQVCPVCAGMPGTLPVLNRQAVDFTLLAGLATNCKINRFSKLDRKNYFYPDLPKAYQISQHELPLCYDGYITVGFGEDSKRIRIERIHLEEDAGKLTHDHDSTYVDLNRCGVPLIEIVSAPDISSPEQARQYLQQLRSIMLYLGISDCKMNEGSLRCDVNISVRKRGDTHFNTRCEIKNINSFSFAVKAIQYEFERQCAIMEQGGTVLQQTLRFDQTSGKTVVMRQKEEAADYRYFPEPDIPPITVEDKHLDFLRSLIPPLPERRIKKYVSLGVSLESAQMLAATGDTADYFDACLETGADAQTLANLITVEIFRLMQDCTYIHISPQRLADVVNMVSSQDISYSTAKRLVGLLYDNGDMDVLSYVKENNLLQINNVSEITAICKQAIDASPKAVADYKGGKTAAIKAILGKAMGISRGNANPTLVEKITLELLN